MRDGDACVLLAAAAGSRRGSWANKVDFLVYTACTRVQTVPLDLYSCTGEMTQFHTGAHPRRVDVLY